MKYPAAPCRRNTPPGHTRRARAVGAAPGACWRVPEAGRSRSQVSASASQARKSSTGTPPDRQHPDCRHIAVGTLVSQRPPHRSGRARQGIRLPSVRRPSELSPHKRRLAHRRGREASCDSSPGAVSSTCCGSPSFRWPRSFPPRTPPRLLHPFVRRFNGTRPSLKSSNTYIAGYEHSFFPSRPGLCVLGMLEASQVPWVDVRTMGSCTNTDGLVLPSHGDGRSRPRAPLPTLPIPSREPTHGSRQKWLVTRFRRTCTAAS